MLDTGKFIGYVYDKLTKKVLSITGRTAIQEIEIQNRDFIKKNQEHKIRFEVISYEEALKRAGYITEKPKEIVIDENKEVKTPVKKTTRKPGRKK